MLSIPQRTQSQVPLCGILMKDLLNIIITERQTLIRGLLISFLLVFPFTFLPTIFSSGWTFHPIIKRIPSSVLYAFGFSFIVVVASVNSSDRLIQHLV